jgi:hypothetical protein
LKILYLFVVVELSWKLLFTMILETIHEVIYIILVKLCNGCFEENNDERTTYTLQLDEMSDSEVLMPTHSELDASWETMHNSVKAEVENEE